MQAKNGNIIVTIIVCSAILLIAGIAGYVNIKDTIPVVPDVQAIVDTAVAGIVIPVVPTAEEVAALINIPKQGDTFLGVRTEKQEIAEELALEEMTDDDFIEDLAEELTSSCGDIDIEEEDIYDIRVVDTEFSGFSSYEPTTDLDGNVELELKVYFYNDGDDDEDEKAKIKVVFNVVDLEYDENYDDAEVDNYNFDFIKAYGDLDC